MSWLEFVPAGGGESKLMDSSGTSGERKSVAKKRITASSVVFLPGSEAGGSCIGGGRGVVDDGGSGGCDQRSSFVS